jgi:hypothetical protein
MSAPITYTSTPINDDYVFTGKKYAISNGRPGSTGFINYRSNPNSKTWYPAYNYNQYHPNGTGYYIISNTRVQGGHATAGNEIPTFQVTGSTDAAILHLINRLQNRTTFYTNIAIAKESIIDDPESLHFDADLSKYNYYAPQFCLLNFDAGNLNCNYKSDDDRLRNLTDVANAFLPQVGTLGNKTSSIDNASFYRIMQSNEESLLGVTSGGLNLNVDDDVEYVVAMRIKIPTLPIGSMEILSTDFTAPFNPDFTLSYVNGVGLRLESNGANVSIGNVSTDFITIIFGRTAELFLHTTDPTNGAQLATNSYTPNKVGFDKLKLASQLNADLLFIGALQVWGGALGIDFNAGTMSGVSQSDFFNQIHTMYAGRWS